MPLNGSSIGKDLTFTLIGPGGTIITLSGLTNYTPKPKTTNLTRKGLDGISEHGAIPDGWEISIKLDRKDAVLDNFFASLEDAYFRGVNISNGTISENIQETDGSVSKFQYTNVSITYDDAGDYKGDSYVPQSITARASRRIKLS